MADTPKVYVLCDANCKWEGMTKEQILTAITQAVENGEITDVDTGFITTVKTINGTGLKFFVGEQHEYDALTDEQKEGLFAIITNDTTREGLLNALAELSGEMKDQAARIEKNAADIKDITDGKKAAGLANAAALLRPTLVAKGTFDASSGFYVSLEAHHLYLIVNNAFAHAALLYIANPNSTTNNLDDDYSTAVVVGNGKLARYKYYGRAIYYEWASIGTDTAFSSVIYGDNVRTHTIYIYDLGGGFGTN